MESGGGVLEKTSHIEVDVEVEVDETCRPRGPIFGSLGFSNLGLSVSIFEYWRLDSL